MFNFINPTAGQIETALIKAGGGTKEGVKAFLRGEYKLNKVRKAASSAASSLVTYWQTREGLYVYPTFSERILPYAKEDATSEIRDVDFIDLSENMCDSEIIAKYFDDIKEAKRNAFTLNQVQSFLDKQWTGGNGSLLMNCSPNIFYIIGKDDILVTLRVVWYGDEWYVRNRTLDGPDYWGASSRFFRNKN